MAGGIFRLVLSGKFMFHIISALAEFERDLIRERTMAATEHPLANRMITVITVAPSLCNR